MEDESAKLTFDYQNGGINVLKPLGDRVVLKAETDEEKTVGGIVLASNVK